MSDIVKLEFYPGAYKEFVRFGRIVCSRYMGNFHVEQLRARSETGLWYARSTGSGLKLEGEGDTPEAALVDLKKRGHEMIEEIERVILKGDRVDDPKRRTLNFTCEETVETKVADEIYAGMHVTVQTLFGRILFTVKSLDREAGMANILSIGGGTFGYLRRRDDGWYDQHVHGNVKGLAKLKFD